MNREELEQDAAAWRAIRVAGRPLVRPDVGEPSLVIRAAVARLAEMRLAARLQGATANGDERPADGAG